MKSLTVVLLVRTVAACLTEDAYKTDERGSGAINKGREIMTCYLLLNLMIKTIPALL